MEKMVIEKKFITLIRSALRNEPVPSGFEMAEDEYLPLFRLSDKHDLSHIVFYMLREAGLCTERDPGFHAMQQKYLKAIRRCARQEYVFKLVSKYLDEAKIPFIPMKGIVVRSLYPEGWMRTSGDIDILIRREDYQKGINTLKEKAEFTPERESGHHYEFVANNHVRIELHRTLMDEHEYEAADVLEEIWDSAVPDDTVSMKRFMRDDWYYYYHILHMLKHFETGGIGARFFADTWLLNHNNPAADEREARNALLERGGISLFEKGVRALSDCWMDDKTVSDPALVTMQKIVFDGGAYGNMNQRVMYSRQKAGGRGRYLISRMIMPNNRLKQIYPAVDRHPVLAAVFQVVRWFRIVFRPGDGRAAYELKISAQKGSISDNEIKEMRHSLGI